MGVSAQAGTGSLPLAEVGDHSSFAFTQPGAVDANFAYPAMGAVANDTQGGREEEGNAGIEVLARFTFCSSVVRRSSTRATPTCGAAAPVRLGSTTLRPRKGRVSLSLRCLLQTTCRGRARLRTTGGRARTVGSASVSVGAGKTRTVSIPLNASGRSLAARRGTTTLALRVDLGAGGTLTRNVKLRGTG